MCYVTFTVCEIDDFGIKERKGISLSDVTLKEWILCMNCYLSRIGRTYLQVEIICNSIADSIAEKLNSS